MIPESAEDKLDRIQRLFRENLHELYDGLLLAGRTRSARGSVRGFIALYMQEGQLFTIFWGATSSLSLTSFEAVRLIGDLSLQPSEANTPAKALLGALSGANAEARRTTLDALHAAQEAVLQYGLPAAFVSFVRVIDGEGDRIVFWHPKGIPLPGRIFGVLKTVALIQHS